MTTLGSEVTAREAEVLALVGQHLTNAQIAEALVISVRTVESHVAALIRKYNVSDRRSLARLAAADRGPRHGTLPVPATAFLGRAVERAELRQALAAQRLVTAVGPGGIGKTRLAISVAGDVAAQHPDGVWFVDLVRVADPAAVTAAVAEVVGVPEQMALSAEAALVASLARRDGLLVLDNCEHLLDGVRECVDLIVNGCPALTVLATSRTRLMLPYERIFAVPGLSVTDDAGGDAVALFAARVAAATGEATPPDPARAAALCRDLDGIALAIELAASRYATLGLDGLEAGLHDRLRFLTVGGQTATRHRSLRDTIAWSYHLLVPGDQALLRRVAVFASWFDVAAANAVVAPDGDRMAVADGLARLADHSLLVVDRGAPTRYRALETIRQYGEEQLTAGEVAAMQAAHDQWCRRQLRELAAADPDDAWCFRFDRVVDEARAALVRCAADPDRRGPAADLATELAGQLWLRGRLTEAQRRYEQAAELSPSPADRVEQLRLAAGAAGSAFLGTEVLRLLREAADLARSLGDLGGAARDLATMSLLLTRTPGIMAQARTEEDAADLRAEVEASSDGSVGVEATIAVERAFAAYDCLSVERCEQVVQQAREAADPALEDAALELLTAVHLQHDDFPAAVATVRRGDAAIAALPMVALNGFAHSDHALYGCEVLLAAGDLRGASDYADRVARLPFNREEGLLGLARRVKVDAFAGHFDAVLRDAARFHKSWERLGEPVVPNLASSASAVAMVHGIRGHDEMRAHWLHLADNLYDGYERAIDTRVWTLTFDALVAMHRGECRAAADRVAIDLDDPDTWWDPGQVLYRPWYAAVWAEAAVLDGRPDAPDRVRRARHAARANPVASAMVERAAALAVGDRTAAETLAATFEALGCPYQQSRTLVLAQSI